MQVIFRRLQSPRPRHLDADHWLVELWYAYADYPVAQAWIDERGGHPILDLILVPDFERRGGRARKLLRECFKRWPNLELTPPVSKGGAALHRRFGKEKK
jgi:hypothetical protein